MLGALPTIHTSVAEGGALKQLRPALDTLAGEVKRNCVLIRGRRNCVLIRGLSALHFACVHVPFEM